MPVDADILHLARQIAQEMRGKGAAATLLTGSQVRGEAHADSDIDLIFLGEGDEYRLERRGAHLVSLSWRSPEAVRRSLLDPGAVGGLVPGLRRAVMIDDPHGIAAQLKEEADSWSWDALGDRLDKWVTEETCGYAEEVHRLVGSMKQGNLSMAAVVRSVLALRLGMVLSVHLRILYETENKLWDLVAEAMGEPWSTVQGQAFGTGDEPFGKTCEAALRLYALAACRVQSLLSRDQYAVVSHACRIAGYPME